MNYFFSVETVFIALRQGRIAIEYFEENAKNKSYAFKCHRKNDKAYPINAIAMNPVYETFASGGGDGTVHIWDSGKRKRISSLPTFQTSVSALSFRYNNIVCHFLNLCRDLFCLFLRSMDGLSLAVAESYAFEEGDIQHPEDRLYIRSLTESDVKVKQQ